MLSFFIPQGSSTSGFGTGGSIFGSNNNSPFGQSLFGTNTSSTGIGSNPTNPTGGLFGGSFGTPGTNLSLGSNFGTNAGFSTNPMGNNMNLNNNIVNDNINNLIKALTHNPFGTSALLKNATAPTGKNELRASYIIFFYFSLYTFIFSLLNYNVLQKLEKMVKK